MAERRTTQYLVSFRRDLAEVLSHSAREFGILGAERYAKLVDQALVHLQENPTRPGASMRPTLAGNVRVYHLAFSRSRSFGETVRTPRHFVWYRFTADHVQFARLLHDSRDLPQHFPQTLKA